MLPSGTRSLSAREVERVRRSLLVALLSVGVLIAGAPELARAQSHWLDAPVAGWNRVGAELPRAPAPRPGAPTCVGSRPADTPEDAALMALGWTLHEGYQAGWGLRVIWATSDYNDVCRPLGYQAFVFADGVFAGTVSPVLMDFQTDGSARTALLRGGDLLVTFARYAPADAPCCPSRPSVYVGYRIVRGPGGPLLEPVLRTNEPQ
jgi:hypothetical protein